MRSLPELELSCFLFLFPPGNGTRACGLNLLGTIPWVEVAYRGPSELLNFAPSPSVWTSSTWMVFLLSGKAPWFHWIYSRTSTHGRGFTLALLWMIPTTCIPAGRMVLGVDDLCELLRPTAFAVALLSTRTGPDGEGAYSSALTASLTGIIFCLLLSGSDRAKLEAASVARQS